MSWRFIVCVILVFSLAACSVTPQKRVDDYHLSAMAHLQQQKNWSFEGRLAVVNETDSVSVSVIWRHDDTNDDIELAGPLAQGRMKIAVTAAQVVVDDGENRKVFYQSADKVMAELLGVDVPVNALKFWVLGVNDPEQPFVEQSDGFFQEGWLIRYREMQKVDIGLLPRKMTAVKDKTRIKLIVDQWVL